MDKDQPVQPNVGDQLLRRVNELIRLQELTLLGPERVLEFAHMDHWVRLHLPLAHTDVIQRRILAHRSFYEASLLADIRSLIRPDSVIVDAGANIGNHTVYFALICGAAQVHAFEPMRVAHSTLLRNLQLNHLTNVVPHHKAVGARDGLAALVRYVEHNTGGTVLNLAKPGTYPVVSIDSLNLDRCNFIKIDVEGAQTLVMEGAAETIKRCRPLIWVELRARHTEFEAGNVRMQSLGYKVIRQVGDSPNDFLFGPA